jgi:hypothetical protein
MATHQKVQISHSTVTDGKIHQRVQINLVKTCMASTSLHQKVQISLVASSNLRHQKVQSNLATHLAAAGFHQRVNP